MAQQKNKRIFPMRAAAAAASLYAALLLAPLAQAAAEDGEAGHGHAKAEAGPQGGELTRDGERSVELLLEERGGRARLKLRGYQKDKPVAAADLAVTAELRRPYAAPERLSFTREADALVSEQPIGEPHFFEIEATVSWAGGGAVRAVLEKEEGKIPLSAEQIAIAGIGTAVAEPAALASSVQFPGEIKFNADRTAHVVPRMAGVVQSVSADLGEQVAKGQLLAVLSSTALSELRSEWLAAVKRRDLAAQTHRREQRLWQEKVSAEQDYQAARTALQEAEIAVQNAEQKLRTVGAATRSKDLGSLEIRAPFDGVVVEKHIALGEALPENANIFTLSDLRTVWAEFVIAPKDLHDVRVGEAATVSSAAFDGKAAGTVSYIGSLLGQQTRTATARVTLENPDMAWRPGLFVSVDVVTRTADAAVTVDADAVQTVDNEPVVFVEVPGGFLVQPVALGKASDKRVEVLSGLAPGARYAARNTFVLKSELGKASAEHAH